MKTFVVGALSISIVAAGYGQTTTASGQAAFVATDYQAAERNGNETVWQRTTYETGPDGVQHPHIHTVTELATDLNHWTGQWVPSSDEITVLPDGTAAGTNCAHQVYFPGDIYNGVIKLVGPSGTVMRSRPIGLCYDDGTNTVMIALLTNSVGYLSASNQTVYPAAFVGISASLQYTYTRAGFEQDVILQGQPVSAPEDFGMDSRHTQLELLTEFFNPPTPAIRTAPMPTQAGMTLSDENIDFGDMQMIEGRAYLLGHDAHDAGTMVAKSWETVYDNGQQRQILVESVPVMALASELLQLPQSSSVKPVRGTVLNVVSSKRLLPAQRLATTPNKYPIKVAGTAKPVSGLIWDYNTVIGSLTNYVFRADSTYYVSGALNLYGTNTFEGGTVIKYAAGAAITELATPLTPKVVFDSAPYRPVVCTAKDDNTVGEGISGSTGNPSGYYANPALGISSAGVQQFSDFRILYAQTALSLSGTRVTNYDAQFVRCAAGISLSSSNDFVGNALFMNVGTNFVLGSGANVIGQNITFNGAAVLMTNAAGGASVALTNCILANVTNDAGTISAGVNGFYNATTIGSGTVTNNYYPFTTVGEGQNYMTNGTAFINAGTASVDATLLALLQKKTVYPPVLYSNTTISASTIFLPQAARDNLGNPSLGYHYDPIDYMFGGVSASSNVTFTAGAVMGWFELPGNGGPGYGLALQNYMTCAFNGTVTAPCAEARYDTVQEGGDGLWKDKGWLAGIIGAGSSSSASAASFINASFTHFAMLTGDPNDVRDYYAALVFQPISSEFWDGGNGGYWITLNATNCLFDRAVFQQVQGESGIAVNIINCTFHGTSLYLGPSSPIPILIENCSFDGTTFTTNGYGNNSSYDTYNYNAYTNSSGILPFGANNVIVTNGFNWQTSWFGNYYLPTNSPVIDKGSTTADQLGLYHFTTQTNQTIEGDSQVDMGYHYVATDGDGNPLDSNGDGIPDYLEDANGNGLVDSGEIGWNISGDLGLSVIISRPSNGSTLP